MTTKVVTVLPDLAVSEIAALLLRKRISAVPVVDAENRILGIVSEGDLIRRPESGTEPEHSWWLQLIESPEEHAVKYTRTHGLRAGDVMTGKVITVSGDTPVAEVAKTLEERHIKRVPVVSDGKLVGIVSRADLLRALAASGTSLAPVAAADDRAISQSIIDLLDREFPVKSEFVSVIVTDGAVHLWGAVDRQEEKTAMRVAAETIAGAGNVTDHLGILSPMVRSVMGAE